MMPDFKIPDWLIGAIVTLLSILWKSQADKIEANRKQARADVMAANEELNRQRDNIAKLFDRLTEHSNRAEERHLELLRELHSGLSGKVDK